MRMIKLITATIALVVVVPGGPATAAPDQRAPATLTLVATWPTGDWAGPLIDDLLAESVLMYASGPTSTLSGPSGTSGELPPGSYDLALLDPDDGAPADPGEPLGGLTTSNGSVLFYSAGEIVCSNAPSGVGAVVLAPGEDVICTFELDLGLVNPPVTALPLVPVPTDPVPPEASAGGGSPEALPVTGPETTVLAVVGTVLVMLGAALALLSRRPRPCAAGYVARGVGVVAEAVEVAREGDEGRVRRGCHR